MIVLATLLTGALTSRTQPEPLLTLAQDPAHDLSWYVHHTPFAMPEVASPAIPHRDFLLTDYGATGNGQMLNTAAFQQAITACSAAGGGRVIGQEDLAITGEGVMDGPGRTGT